MEVKKQTLSIPKFFYVMILTLVVSLGVNSYIQIQAAQAVRDFDATTKKQAQNFQNEIKELKENFNLVLQESDEYQMILEKNTPLLLKQFEGLNQNLNGVKYYFVQSHSSLDNGIQNGKVLMFDINRNLTQISEGLEAVASQTGNASKTLDNTNRVLEEAKDQIEQTTKGSFLKKIFE